jgi:hypothetical protein
MILIAKIHRSHSIYRGEWLTMAAMEAVAALEAESEEREDAPALPRRLSYLSTAEIAECTCPEACERDHDRD